jgi:hypothetical protein
MWRLVLMLMVVSVAACGPSSTGSAASPSAGATSTPTHSGPIAACSVLTSQDAAQLAGVTFAAGTEAGLTCTYTNGNTLVILTVVQAADSTALQAAVQQEQQTLGASGFKQVQLAGADSAYEFLQSGGGMTVSVIQVLRRNVMFVIEALGVATTDATLKAVATTVLGRLP